MSAALVEQVRCLPEQRGLVKDIAGASSSPKFLIAG